MKALITLATKEEWGTEQQLQLTKHYFHAKFDDWAIVPNWASTSFVQWMEEFSTLVLAFLNSVPYSTEVKQLTLDVYIQVNYNNLD